jgi:hypothetical protein
MVVLAAQAAGLVPFIEGEHFFVSGADPQVNETKADQAESCDCGHEMGILF